jgi:hypothetical protein
VGAAHSSIEVFNKMSSVTTSSVSKYKLKYNLCPYEHKFGTNYNSESEQKERKNQDLTTITQLENILKSQHCKFVLVIEPIMIIQNLGTFT